jgi:hypothetical protein
VSQTRAKWEARVAAWQASGQSAEAFTQELGYAASTLCRWASRLGSEASRASRVSTQAPEPHAARHRMVRITPMPTPTSTRDAPLVVRVGEASICLHAGFDPVLMRAAVDALGGAR